MSPDNKFIAVRTRLGALFQETFDDVCAYVGLDREFDWIPQSYRPIARCAYFSIVLSIFILIVRIFITPNLQDIVNAVKIPDVLAYIITVPFIILFFHKHFRKIIILFLLVFYPIQDVLRSIKDKPDFVIIIAYMLVIALVFCVFRKDRLWQFDGVAQIRNWLLILVIAVIYYAVLRMAGFSFALDFGSQIISLWGFIALKAFWEEVVFRGMLFKKFVNPSVSTVWLAVLSSFLFMLSHAGNILKSDLPCHDIPVYFLAGVVFCQVCLYIGNLWLPGILHTAYNILVNEDIKIGGLNNYGSPLIILALMSFILGLYFLQNQKSEPEAPAPRESASV